MCLCIYRWMVNGYPSFWMTYFCCLNAWIFFLVPVYVWLVRTCLTLNTDYEQENFLIYIYLFNIFLVYTIIYYLDSYFWIHWSQFSIYFSVFLVLVLQFGSLQSIRPILGTNRRICRIYFTMMRWSIKIFSNSVVKFIFFFNIK